jgi:hypothetical protein
MTRPRRSRESLLAVLAVTIAPLGVAALAIPSSGAASDDPARPARGELIPPPRLEAPPVDYAAAVAYRDAEISSYLEGVARAEREAAADAARRAAARGRADRSRRYTASAGECSSSCVAHLQRIAACESNGYGDKRNRTYRGRYQFSRETWASVGGSGDPADASPEEQDARARTLYARDGAGQWPRCGA